MLPHTIDHRIPSNEEVQQLLKDKDFEGVLMLHLKFVTSVALKYGTQELPHFQDCWNEGALGLLTACEKYDPDHGATFMTYAAYWMHQRIRRYVAHTRSTIRIPISTRQKMAKIHSDFGGIPPSAEKLGEHLGVRTSAARTILRTFKGSGTAETSIDVEYENSSSRMVEAAEAPPGPCSMQQEALAALEGAKEVLNDREREVIALRFADPKHTLEQCSHIIGRTRERVRQIETNALKKLRARMTALGH